VSLNVCLQGLFLSTMAESNFRRVFTTLLRQTKPDSIRNARTPQCPRRQLSSVTSRAPTLPGSTPQHWQEHKVEAPRQSPEPQRKRPRLERLRRDQDQEPRSFSSFLTDSFAREHDYLRISVTERCNLRCTYCMPADGVELSPPDRLLTTPEIVYLSELFVNQGVNKIRLTGGEPTVRKDIVDLMRQIGRLRNNGLKELCITTNGVSLHRKLDAMVEAGLTGINLSLDTLDPYQFTIMTRRKGHDAVMTSINRILQMKRMGAQLKLKINCVVMRGLNESEILPFVELGRDQDLEVRFIEYMPFDGNKWSERKMLSYGEMLALIREKYPDVEKVADHKNDTSKTYQIPEFTGRFGFITSMTHNFCGTCNRLRITADGNLKVCLFGNAEVSLRDILRESNDGKPIDIQAMEAIKELEMNRRQLLPGSDQAPIESEQESRLLDVIGKAVKRKEEKHAGIGDLENMKNRPMILIGG
jgi:GTP 3',8-cyclase